VAAILLKQAGYEVIGCTFLFYQNEEKNSSAEKVKTIATQLQITHFTIDVMQEFNDKVVQYFIREYKNGKTPFPCAVCNPQVKFKNLIQYATKYGCKFVATGHYALIKKHSNTLFVHKGIDKEKDQSFFLWGLHKYWLSNILFPLGGLKKEQVKKIAGKNGFGKLTTKKESFGLCFVNKDYRQFLRESNIKFNPGDFVDKEGRILGRHNGIGGYTIGQRKRLGLNINTPMFVSDINVNENKIVLAHYSELEKTYIEIENYHFINPLEVQKENIYTAKIRYRLQQTPCKITLIDETRAHIVLLKPEVMIAKGQTVVIYDNERVIGGGFIISSN
jgi:tRNA-specific 2-thiouridylase